MYNLLIFCDYPWLGWLLPLLGLLLGWLIWGKYRSMVDRLDGDVNRLSSVKSDLETDLRESRSKRSEADGEIALLKGRIREMESSAAQGISTITVGGDENKLLSEISVLEDELKYANSKRAELEGEIALLRGKINEIEYAASKVKDGKTSEGSSELEDELKYANSKRAELEGEIALLRGSISEMNANASKLGIADLSSDTAKTPPTSSKSEAVSKFDGLPSDNLQIVEGIGPKMESILKENGVNSWSDLASQSNSDLSNILAKYGDRYRIIDPKPWNEQAALASSGDWEKLIAFQKSLDTGKSRSSSKATDSKVEKMMVKLGLIKIWKENDLKAIEGIGPKIAGLLNDAGINTWRELANTNVTRIKGILEAAGPRYRLADPGTWPKQAELAADGRWDDLEAYQDSLTGGR